MDGDRVLLGEPNVSRLFIDAAYVFEHDATGWIEESKLLGGGFHESFGRAVAIRGDRAAVAVAHRAVTLIFDRITDVWEHSSEISSDPDFFRSWDGYLRWVGKDVLVSAATLIDSAVVFVRQWDGVTWTDSILTSSADANGFTLAATDSLIVAAVTGVSDDAAEVFRLTNGHWVQEASLVPANALFIGHVAVSASTIVLEYFDGTSRALAFFVYDDVVGRWGELQTVPDLRGPIAIEGSRVAALRFPNIVVLERNESTGQWEEIAVLESLYPDRDFSDLALSRNRIVGSRKVDRRHEAEVFALDTLAGEWVQEATLTGTMSPEPIVGGKNECVNGMAGPFPCDRIDLLAYLPTESIGEFQHPTNGGRVVWTVGDVWGWTYEGREFAIVTKEGSLAFVEVTDPENPAYIGYLPTNTGVAIPNRDDTVPDVRVYRDVLYRSEGEVGGGSGWPLVGMALNRLISLEGSTCPDAGPWIRDGICFLPDVSLEVESAGGRLLLEAVNLAVNPETGFLYATQARIEGRTSQVIVDLAFVDLSNPLDPVVVGSYDDPDVDVHEVQCVTYRGPDPDHANKEVCFLSAGSAFQIIDVTDKLNPVRLASASPAEVGFAHQGWLTTDHTHFFMADAIAGNTRTVIWDIMNLDDPQVLSLRDEPTMASANTVYIDESLVFQSALESGVRVFEISADVSDPVEVGWFDTLPATDDGDGSGAWSAYPYFPSGNVIVSSGGQIGSSRVPGQGFFVLRPTSAPVATEDPGVPDRFDLDQNYPNPFYETTIISFSLPLSSRVRINVYDVLGRSVRQLIDQHMPSGRHSVTWEPADLPSGVYVYRLSSSTGVTSRVATLLR